MDSAVRESGKRYGLYGLRRSLTVEHDKSSPIPNDSVGIFGRSLHDLSTIAECTFSPLSVPAKESSRNNVKKILYLDYAKDHKSEYAMDVFVNALERHLNVDRTTINLDEEWEKYRVKSGIDFSLGKVRSKLLYLVFKVKFLTHDPGLITKFMMLQKDRTTSIRPKPLPRIRQVPKRLPSEIPFQPRACRS